MKLLAALLLIGATSAPAFAGGPEPETVDIGIRVVMLSKKSASEKNIVKNMCQAL